MFVSSEFVTEDEKYKRMQSTSAAEPNPSDTSPGTDSDKQLQPEAIGETYPVNPDIVRGLVPSGVDFIVSYACLPETTAWHDAKEGGLYVKALCKHLVQDLEIDVALRYVNQEVRDLLNTYDREGKKYSRQDPFHIIMPPHKFLFLGSA